jgi:hypothetical protein
MKELRLGLLIALASVLGACASQGPDENQTCDNIELEFPPIVSAVLVADVTATDPAGSPYVLTFDARRSGIDLPTNSDCTVTLAPTVTDYEGSTTNQLAGPA